MNYSPTTECDTHPGKQLNKFCKNSNCWMRVCSRCIGEIHKGHKVIEYNALIHEAMNVKENLLQIKKGDLLSLKRIINNTVILQTQLKEAQRKLKEDKKLAETHVLNKIQAIADESEEKHKELNGILNKLHDKLKNIHNVQGQELSKIPELANAVIAEGTIEDLRTFFEMCQQGSESNTEILQYRKRTDKLRKSIEEYAMQSPFQFLFKLNKPLLEELKGNDLSGSGLTNLSKDEKNSNEVVEKPNKAKITTVNHSEVSSLRKNQKKRLSSIAQYSITVSPSQESLCKSARANSGVKTNDLAKLVKGQNTTRCNLIGEFNRTRTTSSISNYNKSNGTVRLTKKTASIIGPIRSSSRSKEPIKNSSRWSSKLRIEVLKGLKQSVLELKKGLRVLASVVNEKLHSIQSISNKFILGSNKQLNKRFTRTNEMKAYKLQLIDFAERVMDSVFKNRFSEGKTLSKSLR